MFANTIIGGAPRSGTTSLFYWLKSHPQVGTSSVKETRFFHDKNQYPFNHLSNVHENALADYEKYFSHNTKDKRIILEASPGYLHSKTALAHLPKLESNPKLIFILRNPVDRIYSSYKFMLNNLGLLDPSTTFDRFLVQACRGESVINPITSSLYSNSVLKWMNAVGNKRVGIYIFEELVKQPEKTLTHISRHLGIDPTYWESFNFFPLNMSRQSHSNIDGVNILDKLGFTYFDNVKTKSVLSIKDDLINDIEKLSDILQRDLDLWL